MGRIVFRAVCVLAVAGTGQALAQGALPKGAKPLPFSTIDRSLPQLLSDGFSIVNLSEGITGSGILLRKQDRWVICTISAAADAKTPQLYTVCQEFGHE